MSRQKANNNKICSKCHISKNLKKSYYVASSSSIHADGRLSICRDCLKDLVNYDDISSVTNTLRMIDRPFQKQTYEDSKESNDPFGEYMRRLAMPHNRWLNYDDSDFEETGLTIDDNKEIAIDLDSATLADMKQKWGVYKTESDYIFLENFYNDYINTYPSDTPAQRNLYKNIARVQLEAKKELANGNTKLYTDLLKASSTLHKDGRINPDQHDVASEDTGTQTYGKWIEEIEKEEPAEYFDNKPIYQDYDSLKKYFEKWFVRPFKNIFNLSRDFDVKDDD